jgi:hypothetical protein
MFPDANTLKYSVRFSSNVYGLGELRNQSVETDEKPGPEDLRLVPAF